MAKLTLADLANLQNEQTAVSRINNNNTLIEDALEKTLSRDGTSPNQMNANLDMNSHRVINLPAPNSDTEPMRRGDIQSIISGNAIFIAGNSFSSVVDVQTSNIPEDVDAIATLGYYSPGDGGGAQYKRALTEPSHPGKIQSVDGAWWEYAENTINVRHLGAIGDGNIANLSADATALENATLIATARGGCPIYLPRGTYYGDTPGGGMVITSNTTVFGDGIGATILKTKTGGSNGINFSGQENIHIHDLTIDCTDSTAGHCIRSGDNGVAGLLIERVKCINGRTYGIGIQGSIGSPDSINKSIHIRDVWIEGSGADGIDIKNRAAENMDIILENIVVTNPGTRAGSGDSFAGIDCRGPVKVSNVYILNMNAGSGVDLCGLRMRPAEEDSSNPGGHYATINGVFAEGGSTQLGRTQGVFIGGNFVQASNIICRNLWRAVNICGSDVNVTNVGGKNYTEVGISIVAIAENPAERVTVTNATLSTTTGTADGIRLNGGKDAAIINPKISGGTYGIRIESGTQRTSVLYNPDDIAPTVATNSISDSSTSGELKLNVDRFAHTSFTVASAATIDLNKVRGDWIEITGTTSISAITLGEGRRRWLRFVSTPTITVGANLIGNNGGGNITAEAGDIALVEGYAAGVVRFFLFRVSGKAVTPSAWTDISSKPTTVAGFGITDAATLTGAETLTNKTISGADNTVTGVAPWQPVASWTYASSVSNVDFTDLADWRELLILGYDLQHNDGSAQALRLRLSTDNGASFASAGGSYQRYGTSLGDSTSMLFAAAGVAAATSFALYVHLTNFNDGSTKTTAIGSMPVLATASPITTLCRRTAAEANNAVRLLLPSGSLTSGELLVFGRR